MSPCFSGVSVPTQLPTITQHSRAASHGWLSLALILILLVGILLLYQNSTVRLVPAHGMPIPSHSSFTCPGTHVPCP